MIIGEKFEYVLATVAIAFGSQWAMRIFKSKAQGKNEEINNLNLIIDRMRLEIDRLEAKIDKMTVEFSVKEKAYRMSYNCANRENCPVIKELNK